MAESSRVSAENGGALADEFMMPNNPTGAFYRDLLFLLAAHSVSFLDISGELAAATRENLEDYGMNPGLSTINWCGWRHAPDDVIEMSFT